MTKSLHEKLGDSFFLLLMNAYDCHMQFVTVSETISDVLKCLLSQDTHVSLVV